MVTSTEEQAPESLVTVIVAFVVNALIAIAKTIAAVVTGSASMVAEAAHSWADTGNEIFLLIAERRGSRRPDRSHPLGYGRDTFIWSLFAAFGLFTAGSAVSIVHGIQELGAEGGHEDYLVNYIVLAISFVLEAISFRQAVRQAKGNAARFGLHPLRFIAQTSRTTLRAVFFEDSAALIGLVLAALGVGLHQLTGSAVFDALGSIAVGILLGVVAIFLMSRNRDYLLGASIWPAQRDEVLRALLAHEEIDRVTYLHLEYVGPMQFFAVAAVDLIGDDPESRLAIRLRGLERQLEESPLITDAVLTLSTPDEPSLTPDSPASGPGHSWLPNER